MNRLRGSTVILPVLDETGVEPLLPIGAAFARSRGSDLVLLGVVEVDGAKALSDGVIAARQLRESLDRMAARASVPVRGYCCNEVGTTEAEIRAA